MTAVSVRISRSADGCDSGRLMTLFETSVKPSISFAIRRALARITSFRSYVSHRCARSRSAASSRPPSRSLACACQRS
jgi:hypothetical protein